MDELIELLADLVVEEINHADDYNNAQHQQVLGSSINSFINIYYQFGRINSMKQAIGYLRQSTTKQQSLTAQKQTIEALAKNTISNTSSFIAISNQAERIIEQVINKSSNAFNKDNVKYYVVIA